MTTASVDLEKRLNELKQEVLKRGFDRHPSVLSSILELPAELQSPAVAKTCEGEALQTIILFPQQIQRGWCYVPKQALIFTDKNIIHLLGSVWPDQGPQITLLSASGLMYLKAKLLLLYGFLEIVAQGPASPTRLEVEFNALFWDRLFPPLQNLLQTTNPMLTAPGNEGKYPPALQQALERLPLKFSNGVKIHGLLPGEELQDLVFQPGTWERRLLVFRKQVTANTLLLLTSNYVVVLQEELGVGQGWIVSYIRRNSIIEIQNRSLNLWNEIKIQLQREGQTAEYKLLLASEATQVWRERWVQHGGFWQEIPDENPK